MRVGSREVGGSSTRWLHLQCAGFQRSLPSASLWLSYTCRAEPAISCSALAEMLKEIVFFFLHLLTWLVYFCVALHMVRREDSHWQRGRTSHRCSTGPHSLRRFSDGACAARLVHTYLGAEKQCRHTPCYIRQTDR